MSRLRTLLMVVSVAAGALLSVPAPVAAHSELTSSTPPANAVLASAPPTVRAMFSDRIEPKFSKATLTVAGGDPRPVPVTVDGKTLKATVPDSLKAAGAWKFSFRVVSVDGHPISGTIPFTVRPATTSTSAPTGTPTASGGSTSVAAAKTSTTPPPASGHQDSDPLQPRRRLIYWVAGIVGAMLLLAAGLFWARDRG
ncbi:copper resistance protein CopC [Phycicoccus sp. Root101]|uniref:copper resistance CopC family protein n=1 Tax=Phycicoccus sp. Root101 TaxID=1736421 RepID=UPI00070352C7|nr:copper resistance protein CopC [Phycicoccus sp. Root101]KQU67388.1 hypothetical protein ASC58_12465 [Phycicoccus sp. Root101]